MENQTNSKNIILNFGLYYGISSIFYSLIMYALNMHLTGGKISVVIAAALIIGFIVSGIQTFKKANGMFLSWGQAVKIGVGIAMVGTVIGLIYQQIFINFIEPDYMNQVAEVQQQAFMDDGLTQEQIEAQMELAKKLQTPLISSAMGLLFFAFVGFVISAIAGAIMSKTEENQY